MVLWIKGDVGWGIVDKWRYRVVYYGYMVLWIWGCIGWVL